MQIEVIENILSKDSLQFHEEELKNLFLRSSEGEQLWGVSRLHWSEDVQYGINGSVYTKRVSSELKQKILQDISKHINIENFNHLNIQHYIWDIGSGLSPHDDGHKKMAMTIHMNLNWNIEWGGIFHWVEDNKIMAHVPKRNTAVINNNKTVHYVDPVNSVAPEWRITLQIWAD